MNTYFLRAISTCGVSLELAELAISWIGVKNQRT